MDLTDAIKEAYDVAPPDVTYYDTLQIDHADFVTPILVVNGYRSITRYIDDEDPPTEGTFLPVLFGFRLPETAGAVRGEMLITIQGVPRSVRAAIRNAASTRTPVTVTYRQYLDDTMAADAEYPVPLTISRINETHIGIEATALAPDLTGAYFPRKLMTTKVLPGLRT